MSATAWLISAYGAALLVLSVVHVLAPQRDGPLALSQVFAPHLFLPLLVLLPLALWRARGRPLLVLLLAFAVGVVRWAPGMIALPPSPSPAAEQLRVMTWNVPEGAEAEQLLVRHLLSSDADIVALQEVKREHVAAIEAEAELVSRFPARQLEPRPTTDGIGLLSRFPLVELSSGSAPPMIVAEVQLDDQRTLTVATAHPRPPRFELAGGLVPIGYSAAQRDAALRHVREELDASAAGDVILLGDFNVTDREPGYEIVSRGLIDAHLDVGVGPGSTWHPAAINGLPFGVLRIDYAFTGGGISPLRTSVDCSVETGDHCSVAAVLELGESSRNGATLSSRPESRRRQR